ncbi:MAG: bacteriohemerythrin [Patescibacteria group bacterium]|jgi:hemerythrin
MISWTTQYSVNIKEIDSQHNAIVAVINELAEFIDKGGEREVIGTIIRKLISIAGFHFATEEKYFVLFKYEEAEVHIKLHRAMTARLEDFRRDFFENGKDVTAELSNFTMVWLADHVLNQDKKYVKCFSEHGLK